jgi:hypothetical protein
VATPGSDYGVMGVRVGVRRWGNLVGWALKCVSEEGCGDLSRKGRGDLSRKGSGDICVERGVGWS